MKAKRIIILSGIICAAIVTYNCSGGASDANKMIAQKWQWESMKSKTMDEQIATLKIQADTTKDSASKAMLDQNVQMMDGIMEAMKTTTMQFNADGTFENSMTMMGKSDTKKGKWTLSADGKKLYSNETKADNSEGKDTLEIRELTSEKLVLIAIDQKNEEMVITMKPIK